jgi:hypothetical protein
LACNLASPYLGHEPKARVVTTIAAINKLDGPTLATTTRLISISIVEHVQNNCSFRGPLQGQIKDDLER